MSPTAPERSSVLRFDLAVQRNHSLVYLLAFLSALAGKAVGTFPLKVGYGLAILVVSFGSSAILYALFKRGIHRRWLNPIWMGIDVAMVTIGVYASGGIVSPWYIWYIAASSAAAFASGRKAAYLVSLANTVGYVGVLLYMGQASWFNGIMMLALTRMLFVFGASYFFLIGVADLQEKRLRIRQLEAEERRKVDELTRLTDELAAANRRILEADKLKSQFLANMSHELRTPMNSIIGFSEILLERLPGRIDPKHLSFLEHIRTSGKHLLGIINDVLDLSKIEAGKMEIYPEYFSIRPVAENVCEVMRGVTKASQQIVLDVPEELPQIETDLAKFKQVLFNLLSNAVKFSPSDRPVVVRAWLEEGSIHVSVTDQGIGIDAEDHALIFEEFRQADGTARREFGGTGLGLALVKRFVELQGGSIAVDSTRGQGSTFTFTLPVRSRAAVVTRTPEPPAPPSARVLVVEDDDNAWNLIAGALRSAGYFPMHARHGEDAIRLAKEARPAAVTLDLVLPDIDGWEVLRRLKSDVATQQLPVVIISMIDNRDLAMALGAEDYFVKPVDRARLLDRLRKVTTANGAKRLLVIDDDESLHTILGEELAGFGFSLVKALNGEDGLRAADEQLPDAILLDLMMPGMSGFEVAAWLKENPRTAAIPILVLTAKDISSAERAVLHTRVSSFVPKGSAARDHLLREIRRVTATPAA